MKKLLSVLLVVLLALGLFPAADAAAAPETALYQFYGDGMLFQQNAPAALAGTAPNGSAITAVLKNAAGETVAEGSAVAKDGAFRVSFPAPAGSFDAYSIVLTANGAVFAELKDVLFGEFWIAAGQSNMAYVYAQAKNYIAPSAYDDALYSKVRILLTPDVPVENGTNGKIPATPQADFPGARWVSADVDDAALCSAVGYWFATDLIEKLNVPVGLASIPLGGSSILTWLSRRAIENNRTLLEQIRADGRYKSLSEWDENDVNVFQDITTMYNTKVAPLSVLQAAGVIWYQGETEAMYGWEYGRYAHAFDLLQDTFTAAFGNGGDPLPMVFTQLAAFRYDTNERLANNQLEFADMQQNRADSRAMVTGYDYPTEFYDELGAIHPCDKEHLGRRMAYAAAGLVYGLHETYTAASLKSSRIADGGVYVTLQDVGDGLVCEDTVLKGFSVAGENGVFVGAEAEIVSNDTVFIHSDTVPEPAAAGYALALSNDTANLWATENGEMTMPAAAFLTDRTHTDAYWQNNAWMCCDAASAWHNLEDYSDSAYYDTWTAENASLQFSESGMRVTGGNKITLSPVLGYRSGVKTVAFSDYDTDWSGYGTLTLKIRNNAGSPLTLSGLWLTNSPATVFCAAANDAGDTAVTIPANGEWTEIDFDLNALYLAGGKIGAVFTSTSLTEVKSMKLVFSAGDGADFELAGFAFTPNRTEQKAMRFGWVFSFITRMAAFFRELFSRLFG